MKLSRPYKKPVVRIDILSLSPKGRGRTITIKETDLEELRRGLKSVLPERHLSKIASKRKARVQCYEHSGYTKGKCRTFTVYGLSVNDIYDKLITSRLVDPFKIEFPSVVRVELLSKGKFKVFSISSDDSKKVFDALKGMIPAQDISYSFSPLEFVKPNRVQVRLNRSEGEKRAGGRKKYDHHVFTVYGYSKEELYEIFMSNIKQ